MLAVEEEHAGGQRLVRVVDGLDAGEAVLTDLLVPAIPGLSDGMHSASALGGALCLTWAGCTRGSLTAKTWSYEG